MQTLTIRRSIETDKNILGFATLSNSRGKIIFNAVSLELPYSANKMKGSCIPMGTYRAIKTKYKSKSEVVLLRNVPERENILLQIGNYSKDTLGSILLGRNIEYSEGTGEHFITQSRLTMNALLSVCDEELFIVIKGTWSIQE
jgi:hypothetical protein